MKRLSVLAASLALAASANAATISYSFTNALAPAEINQSGTLGLFDTALGTLTGASLTVNGAAVFSFNGFHGGLTTVTANITSFTTLSFTTTLSALQSFINDPLSLSHSGLVSFPALQVTMFGPFNETSSSTDDLAGILNWLQAVGGGSFGLNCRSTSGLSGNPGISMFRSTQADCGATITYTYTAGTTAAVEPTAVPEPDTLALISLALAGIGVVPRRRKA